jgi:hypothetical protein
MVAVVRKVKREVSMPVVELKIKIGLKINRITIK